MKTAAYIIFKGNISYVNKVKFYLKVLPAFPNILINQIKNIIEYFLPYRRFRPQYF